MTGRVSPNETLKSTIPPLKRRRQPQSDPTPDLFPSPPVSTPSLERPTKKRKTHHERLQRDQLEVLDQTEIAALRPPQFWDNLTPRIPLVKAALRELDRRNRQTIPHPTPVKTRRLHCDLQRYARQGGPDLSDLRGVRQMPRGATRGRGARGSVQKPQGRGRRGTGSSQNRTSSNQTKTSSPYDAAFKQHLINLKVWPIGHYLETGQQPPPPDNLQEIVAYVNGGRSSLEPEVFTESNFATFQKSYNLAASEEPRSRTLESVEGLELSLSSTYIKRGPVKFSNLRPLLPENLVPGFPDRVYGSRPEKLARAICNDPELNTIILPTSQQDIVCPNLIVHVKGPAGSQETAHVQAVYDGALAARGMEALWIFGRGSGEDLNGDADGAGEAAGGQPHIARTLTCTFAAGVLRIYAVHLRLCTGTLDSPLHNVEYITSPVGAWVMDYSLEDFRRGATAYRNAIEWARAQRDKVIDRANCRVAEAPPASSVLTGSRPGSSSSIDPIA